MPEALMHRLASSSRDYRLRHYAIHTDIRHYMPRRRRYYAATMPRRHIGYYNTLLLMPPELEG